MTQRESPIEHRGVYYYPSRRGAENAIKEMMIRRRYPHARVVEFTRGYAIQLYKSGPYIPLSGDERHSFAGEGDVRENPGAKIRFPIHSYFSAQTAYHDAHRGRGRGKIGNNTYIVQDGTGGYAVVLHRTPIVTYRQGGDIVLNSGGYRTATTKARMNEVLPPDIRIYQEKYDWFVSAPGLAHGESIPFFDNMVLSSDVNEHRQKKPRQNPGKFSSSMDEYVYQLSLDGPTAELGDVEGFGYYARIDGIDFSDIVRAAEDTGEDEHSARKAWEKEFHGTQLRFKDYIPAAILHVDSQGFVGVTYYMNDRAADKAWEKLVEEYDEWESGSEE